MLLAPRKHLFATNFILFFIILFLQKVLRIFCIIEKKACRNCTPKYGRCDDERCVTPTAATPPPSPQPARGFRFIPTSLSKTMRNFGYGEGHFQIFVEEKQRNPPSKSRLNAAAAELKLNPN